MIRYRKPTAAAGIEVAGRPDLSGVVLPDRSSWGMSVSFYFMLRTYYVPYYRML